MRCKNCHVVGIVFVLMFVVAIASGEVAPETALYDNHGKRYVLSQLLQKVQPQGIAILYFTSIHCKPCEKEIPELLQRIKKSPKNVLCYFVYAEGIEEVNAQATQYGITCYFTDVLGTARTSMDVVRFPTIILLRQNREIIGKFTGYNKKNLEQIAKLIGAQ
ncbi:MAG TPA: redoxin domain-containing protein [Spirochaetota bacterium]|nr:redoxin domain-containing protein [Spirochaetota bacterium]